MADEIRIDGMTLSSGVLEKIVSVATAGVEGVEGLGAAGIAGLVQKAGRHEIDVALDEAGSLTVSVHIQVVYGRPIREIASDVRTAVADAVSAQVGRPVASVDVFVDSISFED